MWDAEARTLLTTFTFPDDIQHQQLSIVWQVRVFLTYRTPLFRGKAVFSRTGRRVSTSSVSASTVT